MNVDNYKLNLLDEVESMKRSVFNVDKIKELVAETPSEYVLDNETFLAIIQVFPTLSRYDDLKIKNEILLAFKALFDRVKDYGEAVVTYFESCCHFDDGPLSVKNFPIGRYINEIETCYGNHNDITSEQCLEPSKLFAWALIGNTQECLKHFCNQCVVMPNALLNFLRYIFEHIPAVCSYKANFKNVKGSLILITFRQIIQTYSTFSQNLDTIQHLLLRMTVPRKQKQLSLVLPELLFEEISDHLLRNDMVDFWIHLFADFIRSLKKSSIKMKWNSDSANLYNPVYLCVFLIKILYAQKYPGFNADEIFKNLGDLFKAQNIIFDDTTAFKGCDEIDWATKFSILENLAVPSTSYQREVPAALFHVLSDEAKFKYVEIDDAAPSFENYLIGIFELAFIADQVPEEFIDGGVKHLQTFDASNSIAVCIYRALNNALPFRNIKISENSFDIIGKIFKVFDCQMDLGGAKCTPSLFEAILKLQPCLLIGRAAMAGILNQQYLVPSDSLTLDYQQLDDATRQLVLTFFGLANKFYSPYHDELRSGLDNRSPSILTSKLSTMSAIYVLLKKQTNSISKVLENPPEEMQLFLNRLQDYIQCYIQYVKIVYPGSA
uniref:Uncharacterized protein n=1 Tax=Panagrolaimus superbus TaxID=310955 RepID=A0A914YH57_9BILA